MPATAVPPSTAPEDTPPASPLQASLLKIVGPNALSKSAGTSTGVIGYDPSQSFRPTGDAITISAAPGTGASTAETWAHEISLENVKQQQLQFAYEQQQNAIANAMKQQAAEQATQQQAFSQGITSAQAGREAATAAQQAALAPVSLAQAKQQLQSAPYDTALKKAQAEAAATQAWIQLGGMTLDQAKQARAAQGTFNEFAKYTGGVGTPGLQQAFEKYYNSPDYGQVQKYYQPPVYTTNVISGIDRGGF